MKRRSCYVNSRKVTGTRFELRRVARAVLAGALSAMLVGEPILASATVVKRGPTAGGPQLLGDQRVLHALNRLTFGPRPGDVAAVRAMGLTNWFDQQLNPEKIDDSALDARLAMFPAMQLPQPWLMAKFPSQQMIRQMEQSGAPLPSDPAERAIYADSMAFYKNQQAKQAAAKEAAAAGMASDSGMAEGGMTASGTPASGATVSGMAANGSSDGTANVPRRTRKTPGANEAEGGMAGGSMGTGSMASAGPAGESDAGSLSALPKSDISDPASAPANHVESLFKDLEAVSIINLPPEERMKKILAMSPAAFLAFRQSLSGGEMGQLAEGLNPQQKEILAALQSPTRMVASEELQSRVMRDVYSNRQLEAVMTDFWLNHFNVYLRKNQNETYLIPAYERDVIRPHALGKFEDLLVATAKSPAMLMYLDNWQSVGPNSQAAKMGKGFGARLQNPQVRAALKDRGLNENYGRELMELHTLGVNGGYTQADVTQVAKVFTGWTINQPARGGEYQFEERRHEPGAKTVLGQTIPEGGESEGLQVLHMLATNPATAKFLCTKLAIRFVSDDPPATLVDRMSSSYLASGGDIKTVLHTMFESPEFWAPSVERAKVKTPLEFVVSAVRASGASVNSAQGLVQALDRMGMPLYGMQTPNGYSWLSEPWVSTGALVTRMNFALVLSGDKVQGTRTDWDKLLRQPVTSAKAGVMEAGAKGGDVDPEIAAKEAKLEMVLLGQPVSSRTRATVIAESNDSTAAIQAAREFQGNKAPAPPDAIGGEYNPTLPLRGNATGSYAQRSGIPGDRQAAIMAGLLLGSPEFQRR